MCGIAGIWYNQRIERPLSELTPMLNTLIHRGPDGEGKWNSDNGVVALGHRRLAIIDLSEGGHQPMHLQDRFVVTFNGEIYNYIELRKELQKKGYQFTTDSDTEVLLMAYLAYDKGMLQHLDGMFAFAIYDKLKNELFCARDRFGEKPFYYAFFRSNLYFASEIKAFWSIGVSRSANSQMIYNYLGNNLVEDPNDQSRTFFDGVYKLKAGHYFHYRGGEKVDQKPYWEIDTTTKIDLDINEASTKLMELLVTSVNRRLRSDVKVGTSLSGGLDSSTIVGLVSNVANENHSFSARFKGFQKDEGPFIDVVSKRFNTKHHDIFVDAEKLQSDFESLIYHQDEPFPSGSMYAQYCVYKAARENNVVVMLDGQGADEVLGGYFKHFKAYFCELRKTGVNDQTLKQLIQENHNLSVSLSKKDLLRIYTPKIFEALATLKLKLNNEPPLGITKDFYRESSPKISPFKEFNDLKSMLKYELSQQGIEKLLRFADRNSMAHSVEVRLPFLSHDLVEFIFSLHSSLFFEGGWSKSILRKGTEGLLPREISYRKDKTGFEAPQTQWTKNPVMNDLYMHAKDKLTRGNYINDEYGDRWKTIIAAQYL